MIRHAVRCHQGLLAGCERALALNPYPALADQVRDSRAHQVFKRRCETHSLFACYWRLAHLSTTAPARKWLVRVRYFIRCDQGVLPACDRALTYTWFHATEARLRERRDAILKQQASATIPTPPAQTKKTAETPAPKKPAAPPPKQHADKAPAAKTRPPAQSTQPAVRPFTPWLPTTVVGLLIAAIGLTYFLQRRPADAPPLSASLTQAARSFGHIIAVNQQTVFKVIASLILLGVGVALLVSFTLIASICLVLAGAAYLFATYPRPAR